MLYLEAFCCAHYNFCYEIKTGSRSQITLLLILSVMVD